MKSTMSAVGGEIAPAAVCSVKWCVDLKAPGPVAYFGRRLCILCLDRNKYSCAPQLKISEVFLTLCRRPDLEPRAPRDSEIGLPICSHNRKRGCVPHTSLFSLKTFGTLDGKLMATAIQMALFVHTYEKRAESRQLQVSTPLVCVCGST